MTIETKDGYILSSGTTVRLYNDDGVLISGSIHHYGDGWRLSIHGPLVEDLYLDQVTALAKKRDRLIESLWATQEAIKRCS